MERINNILELITLIFKDKKIYYEQYDEKFEIKFNEFKYTPMTTNLNFRFELEYGCGGSVDEFVKLNNFLEFMKGQNTWMTNDNEYMFPNLKCLYYETEN